MIQTECLNTTDYLENVNNRVCLWCGSFFTPDRSTHVCCSSECKIKRSNKLRQDKRDELAALQRKTQRDKAITFDGRYESLAGVEPQPFRFDRPQQASCSWCGKTFNPARRDQVNCSNQCKREKDDAVQQLKRDKVVEGNTQERNRVYTALNRDKYLSEFIGSYSGPETGVEFDETRRKDKGYVASPSAVHIVAPKPKFTQVTPEDVDWGKRQGRPARQMPRQKLNFCPLCREYVNQDHEHVETKQL